jgi:hypothetical protein
VIAVDGRGHQFIVATTHCNLHLVTVHEGVQGRFLLFQIPHSCFRFVGRSRLHATVQTLASNASMLSRVTNMLWSVEANANSADADQLVRCIRIGRDDILVVARR